MCIAQLVRDRIEEEKEEEKEKAESCRGKRETWGMHDALTEART